MDGLIPLFYKKLRRSNTRRQYECLSSSSVAGAGAGPGPGAAAAESISYSINDFYFNANNGDINRVAAKNINPPVQFKHMRSFSLSEVYGQPSYSGGNRFEGCTLPPEDDVTVANGDSSSPLSAKRLVRFRSRRLFSCVTGA